MKMRLSSSVRAAKAALFVIQFVNPTFGQSTAISEEFPAGFAKSDRLPPAGTQLFTQTSKPDSRPLPSDRPENRQPTPGAPHKAPLIESARRIVFLGDSNTHAGGYINFIEARLRLEDTGRLPEIINLGLPSETCDGLSEPDHPFPRPNVQERLDRVLAKLKPDLVVACYGMNDGIYYPFSEERFSAYKRGINLLIEKIHTAGAKLVLMTPPPFDPLPQRRQKTFRPPGAGKFAWFAIYENYDAEVIKRYADWILEQRGRVEMTIDLHTPVNAFLNKQREKDPNFAMSPDGVHLNEAGHQLLAATILQAWGYGYSGSMEPALLKLVGERQAILRDAWLTEVGHKRPGMEPGLPIAEATAKAAAIETRINALLNARIRAR